MEAQERSARKDVAAASVPTKVAMVAEGGRAAGLGLEAGGGATAAAAVLLSLPISFSLAFIQGAWPSIPPPLA